MVASRIGYVNYFILVAFFAASLTLPAHSIAAPSKHVLNLLERNYHPEITSEVDTPEVINRHCTRYPIRITGTDPFHLRPRDVEVSDYQPTLFGDAKDLKTVILMPPTGGENVLDRGYAKALCLAGIRVTLIRNWEGSTVKELNLEMHDVGTIRMVTAVRHVIEWLQPTRPHQLGILGTSVGGISASLILGYEARVSAGFLIVAGVGMNDIITNSTETGLTKLRELRMKEYGYKNIDEYRDALTPVMLIEPMDFIHYTGFKSVYLVISDSDTTVPTDSQYRLWEAYNRPPLLRYNADHMWTIIRTGTFQRRRVVKFFQKTLH